MQPAKYLCDFIVVSTLIINKSAYRFTFEGKIWLVSWYSSGMKFSSETKIGDSHDESPFMFILLDFACIAWSVPY